MFLLGLEILAGTYLTDRGVKYYQRRKQSRHNILKLKSKATSQELTTTVVEPDENKRVQQETDHYLRTSMIAVGAAIVTPTIPVLMPTSQKARDLLAPRSCAASTRSMSIRSREAYSGRIMNGR